MRPGCIASSKDSLVLQIFLVLSLSRTQQPVFITDLQRCRMYQDCFSHYCCHHVSKKEVYSSPSSKLSHASPHSPQTAEAPNLLITLTVDLEIDAETGECVTSYEQGRITGTGFSYPRPPSRAKTIPAVSLDDSPSEDSGQPQRRHSLSPGVDRSSKDEHEEPQRRVKELESKVETLELQVEEGKRGRERWLLEMETLKNDAVQREIEAKIREVEERTEQNATDTPLVVMPSSNSSSIADAIHLTQPSNNPRPPEVEEARIYPMFPPRSPSGQQGGSVGQKQPSWSPSSHDECSAYERGPAHPEEFGCSIYDTPPPDSSVDNLQQVSWIQTPAWRNGSYADGRPTLPYPSASTDPSYTQLQAPKPVPLNGPAPYGSIEPIGQFQRPSLSTRIDVRNTGRLPYPHGNAANAQQGFPRFLYPDVEGNLLHPYRLQSPQSLHIGALGYTGENTYRPSPTPMYDGENMLQPYRPQSPQFSHFGALGYTGENAYSSSPTPMYGGESNYSRQSPSSRAQQPSTEDPEDDYFVGGFKPLTYLYQPR